MHHKLSGTDTLHSRFDHIYVNFIPCLYTFIFYDLFRTLLACLADVKSWLSNNFLHLNGGKV